MLKRSADTDDIRGHVKSLRRNEPIVVPADASELNAMAKSMLDMPLSSSVSGSPSKTSLEDDNESYITAHNSSDEESEYQEEHNHEDTSTKRKGTIRKHHIVKKEEEIGSTTIGVHAIRPLGIQFGDAVREYVYTENPFPSLSKYDPPCGDVCKKLLGMPKEEDICITDALQEKFNTTVRNCRGQLSQRFKTIMESYQFDSNSMPEKCKDHPRRQFKYMTDAMRFARKDYVSTGAILQSAALGDAICQAFYSGKGRMLNLRPDRQIPRAVIALGFVNMYHYMSRLCVEKRNNASILLDRRGTIRSSMYYTTLKGVFENGETVDWEEVQRVQTNHVRQQLIPGGYMGAYGLPAMSSCYQPKYEDGEYVSGSDED